MDSMWYPTFTLCGERGIIPDIILPPSFRELVISFYEQGRQEDVEKYACELSTLVKGTPFSDYRILLHWHERDGLVHISVGGGGLDFVEGSGRPRFQEHNLGISTGYLSACIGTRYIRELLQSGE